jgi:hypothetical protein
MDARKESREGVALLEALPAQCERDANEMAVGSGSVNRKNLEAESGNGLQRSPTPVTSRPVSSLTACNSAALMSDTSAKPYARSLPGTLFNTPDRGADNAVDGSTTTGE